MKDESAIRLIIWVGDDEVKHWPAPFAGLAPKVRAWLKDMSTGAMVELPKVQRMEAPYALRPRGCEGYYRVIFEGGEFTASEEDTEIRGAVVLEGQTVNRAALALE